MYLKFKICFRLILLSALWVSTARGQDPLTPITLEDFDGGGFAGSFQGPYGGGSADPNSTTRFRNGAHALELSGYDSGSANDWGVIHIRNFEPIQDVSSYNSLEFWFYSEGNDTVRSIQIQLRFSDEVTETPTNIENNWAMRAPVLLAEGFAQWQRVIVPLNTSNFQKTNGNNQDVFALERLQGIGVLVLNNDASNAASPVYVDDIMIRPEGVSGTLTLSGDIEPLYFLADANNSTVVDPDFTMAASSSRTRWRTSTITADYDAGGAWDLIVYTDNPENEVGMVKHIEDPSDADAIIPDTENPFAVGLKFTTNPNADVMDAVDWAGSNNNTPDNTDDDIAPKYNWIFDKDLMNTNVDPPVPVVSILAQSAAPEADSIDFNIGADIASAPPGIYSTIIFVELRIL